MAAIDELVGAFDTAKATAQTEINQLANSVAANDQVTAAKEAGLAAIDAAKSIADIESAKATALKAIRDAIAPAAGKATMEDVKTELKKPENAVFNGIAAKLWWPDSIVQEGSTLKVSGNVGNAAMSSSTWNVPGMGDWTANETLMNQKFPGVTNNSAGVVIAVKVGTEIQFISIGNANAAYAKANPGATYTVVLPNAPDTFAFDLDISGVNF